MDTLFERWYGVRTSGEIDLATLGLAGPDRNYYAPSRWLTLRRILPQNEVDDRDVFIDFGSGMGRVVLQAATYPFERVIGVELSKELYDIAQANVASARRHVVCNEIELVHADATDFAIPDDVSVAFFYNPFGGSSFQTVIARLIESYDRRPRHLRIIYRNPVEEGALLATSRVRPVRSAVEVRPTMDWTQWRSLRMYVVTGPIEATAMLPPSRQSRHRLPELSRPHRIPQPPTEHRP
ncbi:class I SAM-dependent methyltransferase [Pseudonocardia sp. H11422]|uniref:class I SAM-dependent methyltransferase n=1 Tax=Pseudonocardia sp. H11422 TaxID=2835866 RepID=UPI001BDD8839|nr:class I SAM-dependent methyltransferase [Pseudonocardia sp. H11422]